MVPDDASPSNFTRDWLSASLIISITWLITIGLFWPTVMSMVEQWSRSRTFVHGYLVLPASLYLIWTCQNRLQGLHPRPNYWGWLVLGMVGGLWILGGKLNVDLIQQVAVVAILPTFLFTVTGLASTKALLFPLGFLFFAIPTGQALEPPLQEFTAWFAVSGLKLFEVPVLWEGLYITLPTRQWEVATDCAGLRYLLPGLALGYLYSAVVYRSWLRRGVFMVACIVVLILANGLRAFGIILFDYWGIAEGADHRFFSYSIYAATMLPFLWICLKWRDSPTKSTGSIDQQPEFALLQGSTRSLVMAATVGLVILYIVSVLPLPL